MDARATFLGWGWPEIPAGAQLANVLSIAAVPAAGGGGVSFQGVAPLGGTDYLVARSALDRGSNRRVRLVAAGFGLVDFQASYPGSASVGAGASVALDTLFGWGAGPHALESLRLDGGAAGLLLRNGAGVDIAVIQTTGTTLGRCATTALWEVQNPTGAPITVRAHAARLLCHRRSDLTVHVRKVNITPTGGIAGLALAPVGLAHVVHPAPMPNGGEVELYPIVHESTWSELAPGEGYTVHMTQAAAGVVPESARVVARLVLAHWSDGAP